MIDLPNDFFGKRYVPLEQIGAGGMGIVYRAFDRLTRQFIALKRVLTSGSDLKAAALPDGRFMQESRVALAQEFQTLSSLRHPHIISVLDYGFDATGQPFFTMELLENPQNIVTAGRDLSLPGKTELLVQALQALVYLHRRDIIHRDLKPENIQVVNGRVKVVDFGLAIAQSQIIQQYLSGTPPSEVKGTLAYMPPEVMKGDPPGTSADLYSLGMVAYEMYAGKYPFSDTSIDDMIRGILQQVPDVWSLPVPPQLQTVLARVLMKLPQERYSDAGELIDLYAGETGEQVRYDTKAIRESFIQAAQFVGREQELARLTDALNQVKEAVSGQALEDSDGEFIDISAIAGGGSSWLIGGESGSGKSRLLDEVRALALVNGLLVLRGQAVTEAASPYEIMRPVMQRLVLEISLEDSEAAILKPLVRDIADLIERPVNDAPELEPEAARERLLRTIETLFRRVKRPTMVILEDLHRASDSLEMVARLNAIVSELPLLILASYRDDERPDLPAHLPGMNHLPLARLKPDEIAVLCSSITGADHLKPELVDLVQRDTEGNVFFILEVIRALAEDAGRLEDIGTKTLPAQVFSGEMQRVVTYRLNRVPPEAKSLLKAAAVSGRQPDLAVLEALRPEFAESLSLDDWLQRCASAAVLDVQDNHWRFAHDKLREGLLNMLSAEEKKALHGAIAAALESVYPGSPTYTALLAYHWREAENPVKEGQYTLPAGEQALAAGAYHEAIQFLSRARDLAEKGHLSLALPLRIALYRSLGEACYGQGLLRQSQTHLEEALALAGRKLAPGRSPVSGIIRQGLRQVWHRIHMPAPRPSPELLPVVQAAERLLQIFYTNNERLPVIYYVLLGTNLAEQAGLPGRQANFYAAMMIMMSTLGVNPLANTYIRRAMAETERASDPDGQSYVLLLYGIYLAGRGNPDGAREPLQRAMELSKSIGHMRRYEETLSMYTSMHYLLGEWEQAVKLREMLMKVAERQRDSQIHGWSLSSQGQQALRRGEFEDAADLLRRSLQHFDLANEIGGYLRVQGLLLKTFASGGQPDQAQQRAEDILKVIQSIRPARFGLMDGYAAVCDYYLQKMEAQNDESARQRAALVCGHMQRFARAFPIGRPYALLYQAWYDVNTGKSARALTGWRKAAETARAARMPYEEGLALYHGGRHLPAADPQRRAMLTEAAHLLERAGASWEANLALRQV